MPDTPVSIANDLTLLATVVVSVHDAVFPPPVPPAFLPHIELPATIMWPPGFALFQNKLTTTVLHKMMPFALDGHDCGYMIIHIPVPVAPPNLKLPLHIMFSSRKMAFAASTVKANGAAVACSALWIFFPMMVCANPITLPIGLPPFNLLNTVKVHMTPTDVIFGVIGIAVTMVVDAFMFFVMDGGKISTPKASDIFWKLALGDSPKNWAIKAGVGLAMGGARLLAGQDGSLQISVGPGGYWAGSVSLARTDGNWSIGAQGNLGAGVPFGPAAGVQGSAQRTWNQDGTTVDTTSVSVAGGQPLGPGGVAGQHTSSSSTTTDSSGRVVSESETTTDQTVGAEPFVGGTRVNSTTTTTTPGAPPATTGGGAQGGDAFGHVWGEPL